MKVILFQPEIPQNTGNIIRSCSATQVGLILVKPLGFSLSNRMLKRAGLDYFDNVVLQMISSLEEYLETTSDPFYFFSSKATQSFTDVLYPENSLLIFGSETSGLPSHFFQKWEKRFVKIPMQQNARCLNLSNSVAIAIYEGLRQQNFQSFHTN